MHEAPDHQTRVFSWIAHLETRAQHIEACVAKLKHTFGDGQPAKLPAMVGLCADLRFNLRKAARLLTALERQLGVEQQEVPAERTAPAPAPGAAKGRLDGPIGLRGSTRTLGIPEVINLLSSQRKTGSLWLQSGKHRYLLEFLDGAIVHATANTSPQSDKRLGTILVAQQSLNKEQLEELLESIDDANELLGSRLLRTEMVSEDDLRSALETQVRSLFAAVFALQDARYCFLEGTVSDIEKRVCLNATHLLLESARQLDESQGRDDDEEEDEEADLADPRERPALREILALSTLFGTQPTANAAAAVGDDGNDDDA